MFRLHLKLFRRPIQVRNGSNWASPQGLTTSVNLYNPITKSKVPIIVQNNNFLSWYSCGPTVYDETHIGHASSYVRLDIIRRVLLQWFNIQSVVALGVTDIDDKILAKSKDLKVDYSVVAKKYETDFFDAMNKLNIKQPNFILRVTEHIPQIICFVETIVKNGHAYPLKNGDVYFDAKSLPGYGKLTRAPVLIDSPAPAEEGRRRHPADFALWKSAKPNEPSWASPWGPGRPGWHIECSAMASKIFGKSVDVHTGGLDLAFPHHENEEAQSCACHSTSQWVNYWIHTGHLLMNGMKMSKSMKNFIPVATFLNDFTADQFRMLCLMTHYRTSINYTDEAMQKSVAVLAKFETFLKDVESYCRGSWRMGNVSGPALMKELESTKQKLREFLQDDINTAQCINQLEGLVKLATAMLHIEASASQPEGIAEMAAVAQFLKESLLSLGLLQTRLNVTDLSTDYFIEKALDFRNNVRTLAKRMSDKTVRSDLLKSCDTLRSDFEAGGVNVKDLGGGNSSWSRLK